MSHARAPFPSKVSLQPVGPGPADSAALAAGRRDPRPAAAGTAHPADAPRRHARHQRVRRDVPGDDGARGDEGVLAERTAADDGGVGADGGAALTRVGRYRILANDLGARVDDVGEDTGRAEEDVILEGDAGVDETLFWILQ